MYNTYIVKNLLGESISEVDFAQAAPEPLDPESGSPKRGPGEKLG